MQGMRQRIGSGAIVVRDGKVLCVRSVWEGDLRWLPPGGRIDDGEGAHRAAVREAWEETGIRVEAQRVVFVEELVDMDYHLAKFWVLCRDLGGEPTLRNIQRGERGRLLDAAFVDEAQARRDGCIQLLEDPRFWADLPLGFPETRYLGVRRP
ncbi:NUDIX hydrolase [bacterium]|nr:MAG: NUDIX hydrolase [bacterium]